MWNPSRPLIAAFSLLVLCAGYPPPARAQDQTLTVFAAASLKNAVDDIDAARRKAGHE